MLLPQNELTQDDLNEWYRLKEELSRVKTKELLLRKKIFNACFPQPVEGTNNFPLTGGFVLKGKYTLSRDIDIGTFQAMREEFLNAGINYDSLVQYKPSLLLKNYRELTAEQLILFDQCLIIKEGSPALEIVLPKKETK